MTETTLKDGLIGGAIAGSMLLLLVVLIVGVVGPAILALGWFVGWWSFEFTVVALLVLAVYVRIE